MHIKPFTDLPLWPDFLHAPFSLPDDANKTERLKVEQDPIDRLIDVVNPTLSLYPATGDGPRPAVLVCPGGGYSILAWNHEGLDIVSWLNYHGISAFLLKYRCPNRRDAALADVARAVRLVRAQADELNVLPDKIGVIGFSAGAHLAARLCCLPADAEPYEPNDAADEVSCRPDFQFMIYPAYIDRENFGTDPDFSITAETPPAFIIQSQDDFVGESSICYCIALRKAKVPVEMHLYSHGGHGYGLLHNGNPTEVWPELAYNWFCTDIMKSRNW